jgi:DNA-binding Lrp family transcriptional regulator
MQFVGDNQWYENPERWVDALDIQEQGKHSIQLLIDMIVKRPTEFSRFRRLFLKALNNRMVLLPRQKIVLDLALEAKQLGKTETTYISETLGIHRQTAWENLRRAEDRQIIINYQLETKTLTFDTSMAIRSEETVKIELPMTVIDNMIKNDRVACPTSNYFDGCSGMAYVRLGLCPECHEHFKDDMPEWVTFLRDDMRTSARKEARQVLFVSKYGVNSDISDII